MKFSTDPEVTTMTTDERDSIAGSAAEEAAQLAQQAEEQDAELAATMSALAIVTTTRQRAGETLAATAERVVDGIDRGGLDLLEAHGELVTLPIGAYGTCSFGLMDAVLSELEHRISSRRVRS